MDPPRDLDDERIEQILERWFSLRHAGEHPKLEELCADTPELLPRARGLLDRHDALLRDPGFVAEVYHAMWATDDTSGDD